MHVVSQQKRLLTAAVGLPLLGVAVAAGGWPWWILLGAASVVGADEWYTLAGRPGPVLRAVGYGLCVASVIGTAMWGGGWLIGPPLVALWLEQFDFLLRFSCRGEKTLPGGVLTAALLYVATPLAMLGRLTPVETFFVLAAVMAADTGAYYGGGFFGGPKVWPSVSPAKTVSGSLCGLAAGALVGAVFGMFHARGIIPLAVLGAGLALVSQFGDFYESALKRAAGVKDSGRVLPGHGGVLDRIDGLLPAILVYAACRVWWGLAG